MKTSLITIIIIIGLGVAGYFVLRHNDQAEIVNTPMSTSTPEAIQELKVETISEGTGEGAKAGDKLSVLYTGTLTDGTVFDASSLHGNIPFTFQLGAHEVIEGWDQGMTGAKKGEKRKLWIPPDLAYGNASLIFEVEILDVISAE